MGEIGVPAPDGSLAWVCANLPGYLSSLGYTVPIDFSENFFIASSAMLKTGEMDDFMSLAPAVSTLIAVNPEMAEEVENAYKAFIMHRAMHAVDADSPEGRQIVAKQASLRMKAQNAQDEYDQIQKQIAKLQKSIAKSESLIEQAESMQSKPTFSARERCKLALLESKMNRSDSDMLFKDESSRNKLVQIFEEKKFSASELKAMLSEMKSDFNLIKDMNDKASAISFFNEAVKGLNTAIKKENADADSQASLELDKARLESTSEKQKAVQDKIDSLVHELKRSEETVVVKIKPSGSHRQAFIRRNNRAVQPAGSEEADRALRKDFEKLSAADKEIIRDYIRENAQKFRTRLSRNIRTRNHHKLDMEATCKMACGTGGTPVRLAYERQKPGKARIVMLLDISGSCKEASEIMIDFMYEMKDVFPSGCRTYVFVDSLNDVSELLDVPDPDSAVEQVLNTIPTRGVYSNYEAPIKQFKAEHMAEITKDTILLWIGDARNNRNDPALDEFKAMSRKARSAFWLNTEERADWDNGDSIIRKYEQYMDSVFETTNTDELIQALMEIR